MAPRFGWCTWMISVEIPSWSDNDWRFSGEMYCDWLKVFSNSRRWKAVKWVLTALIGSSSLCPVDPWLAWDGKSANRNENWHWETRLAQSNREKRELKQTTTTKATITLPNKRFNEQNYGCARTLLAWNVFVALLCGFRVRRGVCVFILSTAEIGLSCHVMILMRISNLITKVQQIFLSLTDFIVIS